MAPRKKPERKTQKREDHRRGYKEQLTKDFKSRTAESMHKKGKSKKEIKAELDRIDADSHVALSGGKPLRRKMVITHAGAPYRDTGRKHKSSVERETDRMMRELNKRQTHNMEIEAAMESRDECRHGKWRTLASSGTGNTRTVVQTCGRGCGETRTLVGTSAR